MAGKRGAKCAGLATMPEWAEDASRKWVTAEEGARLWQVTVEYFRELAVQWGLERWRRSRKTPFRYPRTEIESVGELRGLKRRWYAEHRRFSGVRQTEKVDVQIARRLFVGTAEAAAILGIARPTVFNLVKEGKLYSYQGQPGRKGSKLWFSRRAVEILKEDESRGVYQARYEKGRVHACGRDPLPREVVENLMDARLPAGWMPTRVAAARLGVHPSRVREMIRTGRLTAHRRIWHGRELRYLYVEAWEVERVLACEEHKKFRARYERSRGEDEESRRAQRECRGVVSQRQWELLVDDDPWSIGI